MFRKTSVGNGRKPTRILLLTAFAALLLIPLTASSRQSHYRHKFRRNYHARSRTPHLTLLKFNQVAKLAQRQRVRYVHLLREAIVQAEREQIAFHSEHATAMNDAPSKQHSGLFGSDQQKLFAMILMPTMPAANADGYSCLPGDPCSLAGRGLYSNDHCIDAGEVSHYPNAGRQQPFQCNILQKCPGGQGALCNPVVFGIPSSSQDACVSVHENYRATQECFGRMKQLAQSNQATAQQAVLSAQGFFKLDQCQLSSSNPGCNAEQSKVTKSDAESDSAAAAIDNLAFNATSDNAYAELIGVVELYQKNGWPIPVTSADKASLTDLTQLLQPQKFESAVNAVTEGVQEIFSDYENHCNQHLDQQVCKGIQNYKPGDYGVERRVLIDREENRQQLLAGKTCGDSGTATVRNVLESQECVELDAKVNSLNSQAQSIVSSLPDPPPTPPPAKPAPHEVDQSYGCESVFRDDSGLFQTAAQCSVCLSENAANRYGTELAAQAKNVSDPAEKSSLENEAYKMQTYTDSTRWKALLSTMALACGDSINGAHDVTSETMAHYVEAFGQCDAKTYDWPDNPIYDPGLLSEIKDITSQSLTNKKLNSESWTKLFKKIDHEGKFKELFGANITQLLPLFCKKGRFHKPWYTLFLRYKANLNVNSQGPGITWSPDAISQFKTQARQQFTEAHVKNLNISPALKNCMSQAIDNAHKLYPDSQTCLSTIHPSAAIDLANAPNLKDALTHMSAAVISNNNSCYVSHSHSTYDGQEGWEYVTPAKLSSATYQADPSTGMTIFENLQKSTAQMPALGTFVCHQSGQAQCEPTKYQWAGSDVIRNYTIIYESASCRDLGASASAAAAAVQQSGSSK